MQMITRKLWPTFCLMLMSVMTLGYAQSYGYNSEPNMPSSSEDAYHMTTDSSYERGSFKTITPAAGPRVAHGADVFITADFIWWKAVQEGTVYASTGIGNAYGNLNLLSVSKGYSRSAANDWSPGFKVGLGLNLCHDGWDIYAQYTWLQPSNSSKISRHFDFNNAARTTASRAVATNGTVIVNSNYDDARFPDWDRARSVWSLHFNAIDLELGRNFFLSQYLTMRPHVGLKGTWQTQDLTSRYFNSNGIPLGSIENLPGPYRIKDKVDNWGIGIRGGFNLAWYFVKNWSIYGRTAWSSLWSDHKFSRKDGVLNPTGVPNGNAPTQANNTFKNHHVVKWVTEVELGLAWEMWFSCDDYHIAAKVGWEQQLWMDWASFQNFLAPTPDHWENLSFHGLTVKFRFDY